MEQNTPVSELQSRSVEAFLLRHSIWLIPLMTWLLLFVIFLLHKQPQKSDLNAIRANGSLAEEATSALVSREIRKTQTGPEFEILQHVKSDTLPQMMSLQRKRALENTLERLIYESLGTIERAYVTLSHREINGKDGSDAPSASVKLVANTPVPRESIIKIQQVAAFAVKGLLPEQVVVLDQYNKVLLP